ncbi:hypothetical protein GCM10010123_14020 [Pilimelia anulata]|uniref:Uncharacterized protein n=1 Tax=Pilimelia anulata TaxID=53371 RepID=A0A8J3FBN7_9ACTN|nr:penicillin-binding protein 2 [Pilimelia anulata]GGJ85527.1 hypothetical protein GCM10010123_14020 [Pilimelia anulata]
MARPSDPRDDADAPARRGGRGGISDARRYTPRGRTVREQAQRAGDPARPALRVVDGAGPDAPVRTRRPARPGSGHDDDPGPADGGAHDERATRTAARGAPRPRPAAGRRGRADDDEAEDAGPRRAAPRRPTADRAAPRATPADRATADRSAARTATGARTGTAGRTDPAGRAGAKGRAAGARSGSAAAARQRLAAHPRRRPLAGIARKLRDRRSAAPPRLGDPRRRLRLATVLALAMFVVVGVRLVGLQVTDASAFARDGLRSRLDRVPLPAKRGAIIDRAGAVLARSVEARYVYADPTQVADPAAAGRLLSPLLGVAQSELLPKLIPHARDDGRPAEFEYLQRGVSPDVAARVADLKLAGVHTAHDERREVPGHDVAANLIGFTGADLDGLEGMEARYDNLLRGRDGEWVFERGADGGQYENLAIPGGYQKQTPAQPGSALRLTLDRDVQFHTQRTLYQHMSRVRATWAAAVVLDASNGEVVAQASYPTYDAADPLRQPARAREDQATSAVVDPGSVHKALVLGAALQEGAIRADAAIEIGPTIKKGDQVFADTHPYYRPRRVSLAGIMAYSSNVGTIKIADRLGAAKLYEYQRRFGLGRATGVGVPGEAPGLVQPPDRWSGSAYGSVPIGHGVAATPVQIAAAYGAIANNGTWIQPHLIKEVIAPDGTVKPGPRPTVRAVLNPANAAVVRRAMEAVVSVRGATGTAAAIRGYRVAGKTGTGKQVVDSKYTPGEVASFVGMAPANAPRYVVAVFAHTPGGEGGAVAAPAFRDIMSFTLSRNKVPPTLSRPPTFVFYP